MHPEEILHGGNETHGYFIQSGLGLIGNYYETRELDSLECVSAFRVHLADLDLNARPGSVRSHPRWPSIRIVPLDRLLLAMKVIHDPQSGRLHYPPGTIEYAKNRSKFQKDEAYAWTGSELELKRHRQIVTAFQYGICAIQQESLGVDSEALTLRLRYFQYQEAIIVLNSASSARTLWKRGHLRPSQKHMVLIAMDEESSILAPFNLFTA